MIAALKSNDNTLMSILSIIYVSNDDHVIDKFLHQKNDDEETILKIVIAQGSNLSIHCTLLNKMEQIFHRNFSTTTLDQCLMNNIGPHRIAQKSIKEENGIINSKNCWQQFFTIAVIVAGPLVKLAILNFDIGTDVWLAVDFHDQKYNHKFVQIECEDPIKVNMTDANHDPIDCLANPAYVNDWIKIPSELSTEAAFNYSLAFLLLPLSSYVMEWAYTKGTKHLKKLRLKVNVQGANEQV